MVFPKPLEKGERVGLAAPSSLVTKDELVLCMDSLRAMGYEVTAGDCLKDTAGGRKRAEPKQRAKELNEMFAKPDIKAVFCIRGGYGCAEVLEFLDYEIIRQHPKVFMGYSDITNLHTVLQQFCGLATFHGPMVKPDMMYGMDAYTWKSMMLAFQLQKHMDFENPGREELYCLVPGRAQGILTGGNLAVLARACGTFYQPDAKGKIIFLEDVGESLDRLDMYLTQLEHAGVFSGVQGVLLGDFTGTGAENEEVEDFFRSRFEQSRIPVISNVYSDHRNSMGTLPFGTECTMDGKNGKISFSR